MVKNLIFLIDGTWVSATDALTKNSHSNVYKLNLYIPTKHAFKELKNKVTDQFIFYEPGIGSDTQGYRYAGGVFAYGIRKIIEKIYINLCSNFDYTSNIYIFGFSRGAVIARALCGLISKCGILKAEDIKAFSTVHDLYKKERWDEGDKKFIETHCFVGDVKVKFLGLFDTVYGGIHKDRGYKSNLHFCSENLRVPLCVENSAHFVSIDEDRYLFRPLIWSGKEPSQTMAQIWVPGTHSDVGGTNDNAIGDICLLTMINLVKNAPGNTMVFADKIHNFGADGYSVDNLKHKICTSSNNIQISKNSQKTKLLIFNHTRGPAGEPSCVHPLVKHISHRMHVYKGKMVDRYPMAEYFSSPRYRANNAQNTIVQNAASFLNEI